MMYQKPAKPERGTPSAREWMGLVAQLPCLCCGATPVQLHHAIHGRFSQGKSSDFDTLPLCPAHHRMLHDQPRVWRAAYGLDCDMLDRVRRQVAALRRRTI